MPGLKEVRIRIASVKSTKQITNAMRMVAASKLRRAQNSILKLRPYAAKLREILQNLRSSINDSKEDTFANERLPEKILLVVIASNRGLCGALNSNVIKATLELLDGTYAGQYRKKQVVLITIGRRVSDFFQKRKYSVVKSYDEFLDQLTFVNVSKLAEKLIKSFVSGEYDRIDLVYNQFKNAAVQRLVVERYLPFESSPSSTTSKSKVDYLFEPDKETILHELIPKTLRIQLFKAILDSYAAEMGARMTAMQQATDNANELLKTLNIAYNKARQNAITNELIEIVSGAEALKG